jgi:two-component system, sensor histidine kinase SagS
VLKSSTLLFLFFEQVDTNMEQVAAKLMSIYSHESRMNDITLNLDLDPSITRFNYLKTDPTRLHQIIGNLVSNSLKFSAGRPVRKVSLAISLSFEPPL